MYEKRFIVPVLFFAVFMFCLTQADQAWSWGKKEIETEKIAVKFTREVVKGSYKTLRTDELKQWLEQKKDMLIVDTMPFEASYKKNHIPGAVQFEFPVTEMNTWDTKATNGKTEKDFIALLGPDKNKIIVIYCGFTRCGRSHNGAMWAVRLGYSNVYRCPGGIKAWKEADFPMEKVK